MHKSASAPTIAHAHAERMPRVVPPLALVPLDHQLQQTQPKHETNQERRRRRHQQDDADTDNDDRHHKRLGERFLAMMATLARLQRTELDEESVTRGSAPPPSPPSPPRAPSPLESSEPTALQLLLDDKRRRNNKASSPVRVPQPVVNVATAPLREHLTFEISMLLPPPLDARQSDLHSPLQRRGRRPRRRKLRRKKRPTGATRTADGRRTWHTSHATWVPHASADYAHARAEDAEAARTTSKLVAKLAALRSSDDARGGENKNDVYAFGDKVTRTKKPSTEEDEAGDEDEENEEDLVDDDDGRPGGPVWNESNRIEKGVEEEDGDDDPEDRNEQGEDTLPPLQRAPLLPPLSTTSVRVAPPPRPSPASSVVRPLQTHPAAWISPDLRAWLLHSGLFRTSSSSCRSCSSIHNH